MLHGPRNPWTAGGDGARAPGLLVYPHGWKRVKLGLQVTTQYAPGCSGSFAGGIKGSWQVKAIIPYD